MIRTPDASAATMKPPVTQVTRAVRSDSRMVPVEEARIVGKALQLLGALQGLSAVEPMQENLRRLLAPTANELAGELRACGWTWPDAEGRAQ